MLDNLAAHKVAGVAEAIGQLIATVPASESTNYLRNCGYGST